MLHLEHEELLAEIPKILPQPLGQLYLLKPLVETRRLYYNCQWHLGPLALKYMILESFTRSWTPAAEHNGVW